MRPVEPVLVQFAVLLLVYGGENCIMTGNFDIKWKIVLEIDRFFAFKINNSFGFSIEQYFIVKFEFFFHF